MQLNTVVADFSVLSEQFKIFNIYINITQEKIRNK